MRLSVLIGAAVALAVAAPPVRAEGIAAAAGAPGARLVTLDYANADVADVLRALAAQSKANIALNPGTKSLVTVHLRNKTVEESIVMVANMAGLEARIVNGTYVVAPRDEMRQALERLGASRVVPVHQIDPKDACAIVEAALPDLTARPQPGNVVLIGATEDIDQGEQLIRQSDALDPGDQPTTLRIKLKNRSATETVAALTKMYKGLVAEPAGDAVVVSGPRDLTDRAMTAVQMLDVPSTSTDEVRVYHVKYVLAGQLTDVLAQLAPNVRVTPGPEANPPTQPQFNILSGQVTGLMGNSSGGGSQGGQQSQQQQQQQEMQYASSPEDRAKRNPHANTLILSGMPADLDAAEKILASIDIPPKQVLIEAKVVETSPELAQNIGVEWNWNTFGVNEAPAGTALDSTTLQPSSPLASPLGTAVFSRIPMAFQANLNLMMRNTLTKVLADPKLTVINDQDASFFVGDTIRVPVLAQVSATAGSNYTVLEVPVGIVLMVHPRATDDGNISLRVHPVVSTLTGLTNGLPQTSAREADTSVRLKDGDTLVLSGLIQETDTKTVSKIPFLGDLPLVGQLFRNQTRDHRRTEIMVFLTVHDLPS